MSKILKNQTMSPIEIKDVGVLIPASPATYTITEQEYLLWAGSLDINTPITSGDIVVNDGSVDLSLSAGLSFIRYPDSASSIRFSSTGPLISTDSNSAINEAAQNADVALNTPRYTLSLVYNGTVGNNTFIGYSNLVPGDSTPIVIPIDSDLTELSFSNQKSASFTLELRKNSTTGTVIHTITKTSTFTFVETEINETFLQGETIFIKYIDQGTNASDAAIVLFFKALPE